MGVYARPNIVTNGLVSYLDATNIKSYPRSGTIWNDLTGNTNSGSLINTPTYSTDGPSILLNGSTQHVECKDIAVIGGSTQLSAFCWVKPTNLAISQAIIAQWDYQTQGCFLFQTSNTVATDVFVAIASTLTDTGGNYNMYNTTLSSNSWNYIGFVYDGSQSTNQTKVKLYINGNLATLSSTVGTIPTSLLNASSTVKIGKFGGTINRNFPGNFGLFQMYTRALSASEIQQNYNATKTRFEIGVPASPYESLTYLATGTITLTNNGTDNVSMFKTSGTSAWDSHFYSTTPFTAPCTIEFNKQAAATDNGVSYAMISWNADPTLDANYTSLDYASYPFQTNAYQVYNNGSLVQNGGAWSTANKFYIVYDTDGFIRHYNGSTLLYSVSSGAGRTVYVDSSLYSVNATFGGFSNVRVRRNSWNGTQYV